MLGVGGDANYGPAGGGGGGYYGGGAGSFCAGGGGSSYASSAQASGAVLRQGANKGDGYVLVYYGASPTAMPTAMPTEATSGSSFNIGTGSFLITKYYVTAGCSGVPTSVMITPTGGCRLAGTSFYQKVLVSGETYAYASYSDSQCTVPSGGDPYYQSSSCSSYNGNYYQPSVATSYDLSALFSGSSDVIVR